MAGAFGLAVQIVEITVELVRYSKAVINAPKEIANFNQDVSYASGYVQALRCVGEKAPKGTECRDDILALFKTGGLGEKYHGLLLEFKKSLQPVKKEHHFEFMAKVEKKSQRWMWSFKKGEAQEKMQRLQTYQEQLQGCQLTILMKMINASDASTAAALERIDSNVAQTRRLLDNKAFRDACNEFSTFNFAPLVRTKLNKAGPSWPKWVLEEPSFRAWAMNQTQNKQRVRERVLWASGASGVGKSTIAAAVVNRLLPTLHPEDALVCFFCESLKGAENQADIVMRSMAGQLFEQLTSKNETNFDAALHSLNAAYVTSIIHQGDEEYFNGIDSSQKSQLSTLSGDDVEEYTLDDQQDAILIQTSLDSRKREKYLLSTEDYVSFARHLLRQIPSVKLVEIMLRNFRTCFFIVDALDELWTDKASREELRTLIAQLADLVNDCPNFNLLIISQPKIGHFFEERADFATASRLKLVAQNQDINSFARGKIELSLRSGRHALAQLDDDRREEVIQKVIRKSNGQFLAAVRHMATITNCTNIAEVEAYVDSMSGDLSETADLAIARIKAQSPDERKLGMRALMWAVSSKRPLRVEQLKHALATYEPRYPGQFNRHAFPDERDITATSKDLVDISDETVTIHHSLRDYFSLHENRKAREHFPNSAEEMASICLEYLSSEPFGKEHVDERHNMSFAEYAAQCWGLHAHDASSATLSNKIFNLFNKPIHMAWAGYFIWRNFPAEIAEELGLPAAVGIREAIREASQRQQTHQVDHSASLFLASYFGLDKSIESLLTDYQVNVDTVPFQYRQSAICAAIFGRNSSTIDLLLRHSAATSLRSTSDATPLHLAARLGHRKNVKTLLHHRAELLNVQDAGGKTALHIACENGHAAVVRVLLQHNANVKLEDNGATGHRPALHRAVRNGRGKVVAVYYEILGLKGIEARSEEWKDTALHQTAIGNVSHLTESLLKLGADKQAIQRQGKTPLHIAAECGSYDTAKVLLKHNVVTSSRDEDSNAPLHLAAGRGNLDLIRLLLTEKDAKMRLDSENRFGETPLRLAVLGGHDDCVRVLLECGADYTIPNMNGNTVLIQASRRGSVNIIKMVLSSGNRLDASIINAQNTNGDTAVFWACRNKQHETAMALVRAGADLSIANRGLSHSAVNRAVVRGYPAKQLDELLQIARLTPQQLDVRNAQGLTPLALAEKLQRTGAARVLRKYGAS